MGWSLSGPKTTVRWAKRKVFGRDDFPEEGQLSRKHFEVVERKGRVYVQDLSSRNGTFIYGQQVKVGEAIEIQPGDSIKVGETNFTLKPVEDFAPIWVEIGIFTLMALIALRDPYNGWGPEVGWMGSAVVLSLLLVSFVAVATASNFVILRLLKKFWNKKTYAAHGIAIFLMTIFVNQFLTVLADTQFGIGADLRQSRIEYYCMTDFRGNRCAYLSKKYPQAVEQIDKWKRDLMAEKMKAYEASRARLPAAANSK